jgi:acyl carrier protein
VTTTYEKLSILLAARFGVPAEETEPAATFDQLDLDSLAVAELVLVAGEEFGVPITDRDMRPGNTAWAAGRDR